MKAKFAYVPGTIAICHAHYARTPAYVPRIGAVISALDHGCEVCSGREALRQNAYSHDQIRGLRSDAASADDADTVALCDRALAGDSSAYMECAVVLDCAL